MTYLQTFNLLSQPVDVHTARIQKRFVVCADHQVRIVLQPPWVATEFPLGTGVRPGAEYYKKAFFLRGTDIVQPGYGCRS